MSSPGTPVTSRSGHMRGRKRINAHPIKVLRLADPRPYLLEMAKIDMDYKLDIIGANTQGVDSKDGVNANCLQGGKGS